MPREDPSIYSHHLLSPCRCVCLSPRVLMLFSHLIQRGLLIHFRPFWGVILMMNDDTQRETERNAPGMWFLFLISYFYFFSLTFSSHSIPYNHRRRASFLLFPFSVSFPLRLNLHHPSHFPIYMLMKIQFGGGWRDDSARDDNDGPNDGGVTILPTVFSLFFFRAATATTV